MPYNIILHGFFFLEKVIRGCISDVSNVNFAKKKEKRNISIS